MSEKKVNYVCKTCGSDLVLRDAYAEWDQDKQDWVIHAVYDAAVCEGECNGEGCQIEEVELKLE